MKVVAKLNSGNKIRALAFSANGECVVSGNDKNVRVWRVSDGKKIKTLAAGLVSCLAVSQDGRWVAAGTMSGDKLMVWAAQQGYKKVSTPRIHYIIALDFSPDSHQLLTADINRTVTIFDVPNHKRVLTLQHADEITAAKYSRQGDRFAVATSKFIRIYNRDNFDLSVDVSAEVTPWYNTGLLWSNDQLFIISGSRIKQIDTATGSVASEWPVPGSVSSSCIALHQHVNGESIVYSTKHDVTIWETSSEHKQLDLIRHSQMICSVAISPDHEYLAIGGEMEEIIVRQLPRNLIIPLPEPDPSPPPILPPNLAESRYINPADTEEEIRRAIQNVIRDTPGVLIDTESGRLLDKARRAVWFESLPIFNELVSAMTTQIDVARINREVAKYYRYATLSHTWERVGEPTFEEVTCTVVYDLDSDSEASNTHNKLKMFCKIARKAGFHWAWSDTCCINKSDNVVLQEALVAMFRWYQGSSLTIIFLRGVRSPSRRGDLVRSIWNTRAWTFQEYHASKVVRFYNEDWKLYLDLDIPNHKESPEITSEMEQALLQATRVSASMLRALKPGLNNIREKLCLAARRQTTRVEDAAYSLLGIFSQPLPLMYGEEDKALGRLLSQLLTSSGDTSILAWTGKSGSFNSCLPANVSVFSDLQTTHIPSVTKDVQIPTGIQAWLHAFATFSFVTELHALPLPLFVGRRMKLPCITFNVKNLSTDFDESRRFFSAQTDVLGTVRIDTDEDLNRLGPLCLAHPWIDFLLDRRPVDTSTHHSQDLEENINSLTPAPQPF